MATLNTQSNINRIVGSVIVAGLLGTSLFAKPHHIISEGGGFNDSIRNANKSNIDPLEKASKDLKGFQSQLEDVFKITKHSRQQQEIYLSTIVLYQNYLNAYINVRGSCLSLEDLYTISTTSSTSQGVRDYQNKVVDNCYKDAQSSLERYGDISDVMSKTYQEMIDLRDMAVAAGANAERLNKAIVSCKAAIDFLKREGSVS